LKKVLRMAKLPVRTDGKETLNRILDNAKRLFAANGFRGVSIPMVARLAGIRTPSFYHYFSDKISLYKEIVEHALEDFRNYIERPLPQDLEGFLRSFMDNYLGFMLDFPEDFRILKEACHFSESILESVNKLIHSILDRLPIPGVEEMNSKILELFIISPVRWIGTHKSLRPDYRFDKLALVNDLLDFALHGFDPGSHRPSNEAFEVSFQPMILEMKSTRAALMEAAESLFGTQGFHDTYISDITRNAGVASGTFYVHFKDKRAILEELIAATSRGLRHTVATVIANFSDRRDAEIAGFKANLEYFRVHKNMCNIVNETEFIYPEIWKDYYDRIQNSWIRAIKKAFQDNQMRPFDPSRLSLFLMGIGHYLTEDLVVHGNGSSEDFASSLRDLSRFLYKGLNSAIRM